MSNMPGYLQTSKGSVMWPQFLLGMPTYTGTSRLVCSSIFEATFKHPAIKARLVDGSFVGYLVER